MKHDESHNPGGSFTVSEYSAFAFGVLVGFVLFLALTELLITWVYRKFF